MTSRARRSIAAGVVAIVLAPGLTATLGWTGDDYPLSSYPMFTRARPATATFVGAVVADVDGDERRLSPGQVSGTPEPLQATALVEDALVGDPARLCEAITGRVELRTGERLLLVRDRVDAVAHYTGGDDPTGERVDVVDCVEATR